MNFREILEARKKALEAKRAELVKRSNESEDLAEVRAINAQLEALAEDLQSVTELIAACPDEADEQRSENAQQPAQAFNPIATYGAQQSAQRDAGTGTTDSIEYRTAFMNFVLKRSAIPANVLENAGVRADQNTTTNDVSATIPSVIVNRIVQAMADCGMILPLVTRTFFAAGIVVPTSNVRPVASWIAEGASSDRQKKTTGTVTFSYYKLRCEISMSMEVGTMAISAFEDLFVRQVSEAMVIALEKAILYGSGSGAPKGIMRETPATNKTLAGAVPTYTELCEIEGAVPAQYESTAKWFMTKANFMKVIGIVDDNGQPIARINYGIDGKAERVILGREVVIHPYAAEMNGKFGAIVDFKDYVLNTIYNMSISHKQDWDTEDYLTKAVMSADGKLLSTDSLIMVTAHA